MRTVTEYADGHPAIVARREPTAARMGESKKYVSALVLGNQRPRRIRSPEFIVDARPDEIGPETDGFRHAGHNVEHPR